MKKAIMGLTISVIGGLALLTGAMGFMLVTGGSGLGILSAAAVGGFLLMLPLADKILGRKVIEEVLEHNFALSFGGGVILIIGLLACIYTLFVLAILG